MKKSKYIQIAKIEVDDFVAVIDCLILNREKVSKRKLQWISLINSSKLFCSHTNKKVSYVSYDVTNNHISKQSYHFNFYTEDDELVTIDHIYPKSLGGSEMDVNNLQPMIGVYNWLKGSSVL